MKILKSIIYRLFVMALCAGLLGLMACEPDTLDAAAIEDVTPTTGIPEPACTSDDSTDTDADTVVNDCDDDDDADDVADESDNCSLVSNADQIDTDADASGDECDDDDDADGVADESDNCSLVSNADQTDTDADASGDACDEDDDADGVADASDNCSLVSNVDQTDTDADASGDTCDDDDDGDTVADDSDVYPLDATESVDSDGDDVGDNADVCPNRIDDQSDTDADGVGDICDNCTDVSNADQTDLDEDGEGDLCDQDIDGDEDLAISYGGTDCDDEDARQSGIHPEIFDFLDNNCDTTDGYDLGVNLGNETARIEGETAGDEFGYAVSILGDVNGDGFDDVMLGAPKNDDAASGAGKAYLFFGAESGLSGALDPLNANVIITGEASNNYFGWSIAGPGDVDGDGIDDILIGAKWNNSAGTRAGKAYLIYGRDFTEQEFSLTSADATFTGGAARNYLGSAVSGAGDTNGDGLADILISATGYGTSAGRVYLFNGGALSGAVSLDNAYAVFDGDASYDGAGSSLAQAGDMDGDGLGDFIVGAPSSDPNGKSAAGTVYVVFGSSITAGVNLLDDAELKYIGENANNNAGNMISGNVDVDADGLSDIIIGAYGYDVGSSTNEGRVYLIFGSDSYTAGTYNLDTATMIFDAEAAGDYAGVSASLMSDMDGDGFGEILIGAYYNDDAANAAGKIYFVRGMSQDEFGDLGGQMTLSDTTADATLLGETTGNYAGNSLSASGDVNADGFQDIVIGAKGYDGADGLDTGKAYLLMGE